MAHLQGKIAMVSGSGRGIGRELARKLAREGARVVVNGHA
jgi:3-oxoacyl-[acyl-carrier protein] reductase